MTYRSPTEPPLLEAPQGESAAELIGTALMALALALVFGLLTGSYWGCLVLLFLMPPSLYRVHTPVTIPRADRRDTT
jgi:hypothetical protein